MKKLILAGAAALAFTAAPAMADHHMNDMSAEQTAMVGEWPADRQATYKTWPADYQTYYWTLTPTQQDGWWVLTNDQRKKVYDLTPDQRTVAWTSIVSQMGGTATAAATMTSAAATSGNVRFVSGERVQATPSGYTQATAGADLPVCSANQQDGCINSWEKNKTGNRPLNYWPGKPASEM